MTYGKPFLDINQQIALLASRGLVISDVAKAQAYLERIGYYRLSGYSYPFRDSVVKVDLATNRRTTTVKDTFQPATEFGTFVDLYVFDKKLRLLLLDAIERIEIAFRVQIALQTGVRNPLAHRDPSELHPNFSRLIPGTKVTKHQEWLRRVDKAFDESKEEFVKHFKKNYPGDHLPIWMCCELWDFGSLSFLYSGLKKIDQTAIASKYGLSFSVVESWLRALNIARNVCAHHARLWNRPTVNQPKWPTAQEAPELAHIAANTHAQTRFYGTAALTRHLLKHINPTTTWPQRLKKLCQQFPASSSVNLRAAGFPLGWDQKSLWA